MTTTFGSCIVVFFQAEDGIRDLTVTGVQTCALPIWVGWLAVRRVPESWARWVFRQIADILWRRRGKGVQQLEANLRRVVPGATGKQLRQLSRAGMRSYLRYFMEAFRLPVMPRERIVSGMYVAGEE